jgi:hypothetical protein
MGHNSNRSTYGDLWLGPRAVMSFAHKNNYGSYCDICPGIRSVKEFREYMADLMSIGEHRTSSLGWMAGILLIFSMVMCWREKDIPQNLSTVLIVAMRLFCQFSYHG